MKTKTKSNWFFGLLRLTGLFLLGFILLLGSAAGWLIYKRIQVSFPWVPMYVSDTFKPNPARSYAGTQHVIFMIASPVSGTLDTSLAHLKTTADEAKKHRDSDGMPPKTTWFWRDSETDNSQKKHLLNRLSRYAFEGRGEVELQIHHADDSPEGLAVRINHAIALANETGSLITTGAPPQKVFGFFHGSWGLDNSRGDAYCGINGELILLQGLGCYADFTMPAWGKMHPAMVNRMYYALDDPLKPKSYDSGPEVIAGGVVPKGLFMFTGQSSLRWAGLMPSYDHGEIRSNDLPDSARIDRWVRQGFHVQGRPEWLFIKTVISSNLQQDTSALAANWREPMFRHLEERYNDGRRYFLHYVTAREAYNIAKAAEAGKSGNPNDYRNFLIPPYVNRLLYASEPYRLTSFDLQSAEVIFSVPYGQKIEMKLKAKNVKISGDADVQSHDAFSDETRLVLISKGKGTVRITVSAWTKLR